MGRVLYFYVIDILICILVLHYSGHENDSLGHVWLSKQGQICHVHLNRT